MELASNFDLNICGGQLGLCTKRGLALEPLQTWFLLSRATVIPTPGEGMALWRERLFAAMARNARTAGDYFNLPAGPSNALGTKNQIWTVAWGGQTTNL